MLKCGHLTNDGFIGCSFLQPKPATAQAARPCDLSEVSSAPDDGLSDLDLLGAVDIGWTKEDYEAERKQEEAKASRKRKASEAALRGAQPPLPPPDLGDDDDDALFLAALDAAVPTTAATGDVPGAVAGPASATTVAVHEDGDDALFLAALEASPPTPVVSCPADSPLPAKLSVVDPPVVDDDDLLAALASVEVPPAPVAAAQPAEAQPSPPPPATATTAPTSADLAATAPTSPRNPAAPPRSNRLILPLLVVAQFELIGPGLVAFDLQPLASSRATASNRSSLVGKRTRTGTAVESSDTPGSIASIMLPHARRLVAFMLEQGVNTASLEEDRCLATFSLHQHNALCTLLAHATNVRVEPLPAWLLNLFSNDRSFSYKRYSSALQERTGAGGSSLDLSKVPATLLSKLYPFQREGVEFAVSLRGRVLIGDEMGLGKTLQAVAVASAFPQDWPVVVVCPATLRINWARAFLENVPTLRTSADVCVVASGRDPIPDAAQVIVLSYEIAATQVDRLRGMRRPPSVAIVDESHYLKNPQSKRCQQLAPFLTRFVKRCILLSGTPALSRPLELFPQLQILDRRLFSSRHDFGLRYCNGKRSQFGWDFSGATHCKELHFVLERTLMIRRLKRHVLSQLPGKTRECVRLEIPTRSRGAIAGIMAQAAEARQAVAAASARGDRDARNAASSRLRGTALSMFQDTGRVKVPATLAHIDYLLESSESLKFLVFAHHRDVLDAIEGHLQRRRVGRIRIDGRTRAADRADLVDLFQTDDSVRVAVLSITAAGTGLTLTAASLVVMAELFWNPGHLQQCEDRVHRIGQASPVRVQYLVAVGTVDESMWDLLSQKLQVVGQTLNGTQGSGTMAAEVTSTRTEADDGPLGPGDNTFVDELLDRVSTFAERSVDARQAAAHRAAERERVAAGPVEESVIPVLLDDGLSESEETEALLGGGLGGSDPANCRDSSHEFALDLGAEMVLSQGEVDLM
eukprot:CAMPEP_0170737938 /NCGR_PEP_ID=MMETSP0437-20130122/4389_1 /TAXON_ID=0 /ORGANISM="Sexangularia sp." /LENGTH=977 /DNA_ID=CAMNT_0011076349 /DNA_START=12 /DNA_END=2945 /DNA_ORIENTATION=+